MRLSAGNEIPRNKVASSESETGPSCVTTASRSFVSLWCVGWDATVGHHAESQSILFENEAVKHNHYQPLDSCNHHSIYVYILCVLCIII